MKIKNYKYFSLKISGAGVNAMGFALNNLNPEKKIWMTMSYATELWMQIVIL
jgi:hypothetical protein